jgi:hypothetical protein
MLAGMHLASIDDLADVEPVLEQMGKRSHAEADTAAAAAVATAIDLGPDALPIELQEQSAHGATLQIACEDGADHFRLLGLDFELFVDAAIAEWNGSAHPEAPLRLEAAILSRTRSPITSRSNWAKESNTLRVSRPMLEVVLNDWVMDTNETPCWSNNSTSLAKSASERVRRSTL